MSINAAGSVSSFAFPAISTTGPQAPEGAAPFADPAAVAIRPKASPPNDGWQLLTAGDWDLLSAAAGKEVGPNASARVGGAPLMPLIAGDMINARRSGTVAPSQSFSPEFFQTQLALQPAEMHEQLHRAIAYATQHDPGQAGQRNGYIDFAAARVDARG